MKGSGRGQVCSLDFNLSGHIPAHDLSQEVPPPITGSLDRVLSNRGVGFPL